MAQNIIVYLIVALAVAYAGYSVYRIVTRRKDPCSGCAGCDLKKELDRKRKSGDKNDCNEYKPK